MARNVCRARDCSFVRLKSFPFHWQTADLQSERISRRSFFSLESLILETRSSLNFIEKSAEKKPFHWFLTRAAACSKPWWQFLEEAGAEKEELWWRWKVVLFILPSPLKSISSIIIITSWERRKEKGEKKKMEGKKNPFSASSDSFGAEDSSKKKSNLIWKPEMKTPVISAQIFPFSSTFLCVRFWWFVRHF